MKSRCGGEKVGAGVQTAADQGLQADADRGTPIRADQRPNDGSPGLTKLTGAEQPLLLFGEFGLRQRAFGTQFGEFA